MAAHIKEFHFDNAAWRIDCLGGLLHPGGRHSEPSLRVFLSKLDDDGGDPLLNKSLVWPPEQKVATVNAGLISLLRKGSVWDDGICVPPIKEPRSATFNLHSEQLSFIRFDGKVEIDGVPQLLLAPERYRLGGIAAQQAAGAWLAVAFHPNSEFVVVAIPCTALFQKCAATSPKAVRRLLLGEIDKIIDSSCGFMTDEPSTFYVEMFKDFRNSEAKAIANLVADPIGQREYARLRNTLAAESANWDHSSARGTPVAHLKFGLPFSNRVELEVQGKAIKFKSEKDGKPVERWGFLATNITALKTRLVFDQIVVGRKNDGKKGDNANDPDLQGAWGKPPQGTVEPTTPDQPIDSTLEPSKDLEALCLEAAGDFEAEGLVIEDREKETQEYASRPRISSDGSLFTGNGATGDPRGDGTGIVEIDLEPVETPKTPVTLEDFFASLDFLASEGYAFRTIPTSHSYRSRDGGNGVVNFWPIAVRRCHSWHLMVNGRSKVPRAYVIAELERGGVWHYLVEIQRKGTAMSLQHIRAQDGRAISRPKLAQFMIDVAVENGWGAKDFYKSWIFTRIVHPSDDRIEGLARAIINVL